MDYLSQDEIELIHKMTDKPNEVSNSFASRAKQLDEQIALLLKSSFGASKSSSSYPINPL